MTTKQDIIKSLRQAGLTAGDHVVVHSSLRSVGPIEGGADTFIDALLEVVGDRGTLAMPSFNYTRPLPEPYFDAQLTAGRTGSLTEVFRKRATTLRSIHPTHSVCATGPRAVEFLADHLKVEAVGAGSPLDRIAQAGGYILMVGVTHVVNTTIHVGESYAGIPKFFWSAGTLPVAKVLLNDGRVIEHQIDCSASCDRAFNAVEFPMRARQAIIDLDIGQASSWLMRGAELIDVVVSTIRGQPDVLLCNYPFCRPCALARTQLAKHGLLERKPTWQKGLMNR